MALMSVLDVLREKAESQEKQLRAALADIKKVRARLKRLDNSSRLSFRVELVSLWASEGEKSTTTTVKGSLSEAVTQAIAEFKKTNSRSDVQANYRVVAILPGKPHAEIQLPEPYWGHLKDKT